MDTGETESDPVIRDSRADKGSREYKDSRADKGSREYKDSRADKGSREYKDSRADDRRADLRKEVPYGGI